MATFQINDDEWYALRELSMLARNVYFVLRRYMDFKTGLTGKVYFVSLDTIINELSIPAKRGSAGYIPSVKEIRVALDSLEKNRLISRDSKKNKADKHAVYKLNLADFDDANLGNSRAKNNGSIYGKEESTNYGKEKETVQASNSSGSQVINNDNQGKEESANNGSIYGKANPPNLGDIPIYPIYKTTTTNAREVFPMHLDWLPDLKILKPYLLNMGFGVFEKVPIETIQAFRAHWSTRQDLEKNQAKWCSLLATWHKNDIERGKANANRYSNSQQPAKESLVERVSRRLEDWANS